MLDRVGEDMRDARAERSRQFSEEQREILLRCGGNEEIQRLPLGLDKDSEPFTFGAGIDAELHGLPIRRRA